MRTQRIERRKKTKREKRRKATVKMKKAVKISMLRRGEARVAYQKRRRLHLANFGKSL